MILLSVNNASTTLGAGIGSSTTTIPLAPGTGALFPSPGANEYFTLTLNDLATGNIYEICYCTARTGDSCTVTRGQESTSAASWLLGDYAYNTETADSINAARAYATTNTPTLPFTIPAAHQGATQLCGSTGTITLPAVSGLPDGFLCPIVVTSGSATITVNPNSATVVLSSGSTSSPFTLSGLAASLLLQWNIAATSWFQVNTSTASGPAGGSLAGNYPDPTISANVPLPGSPTTTTQATNDSSTKVATTAFANPGSSLLTGGYQILPSGLILQWFNYLAPPGSSLVNFPVAFGTAALSTMISFESATPPVGQAIGVQISSTTQCSVYNTNSGSNNTNIWALGH